MATVAPIVVASETTGSKAPPPMTRSAADKAAVASAICWVAGRSGWQQMNSSLSTSSR